MIKYKLTYTLAVVSIMALATGCKPKAAQTSSATMYTPIDPAQCVALLHGDPSIKVLDVRTPEEVASGKIDGAIEIDYLDGQYGSELALLDKEATYVVYCKGGSRSAKVAADMIQQGFGKVYELHDGYQKYEDYISQPK